ncbi:MAG TPA: glycosyltransferase [Ferruginibacter sp.]|nr:glycosyltransferase [Ferruginibacter sp.]
MQASVIISYYKNLPKLELLLMALQQQTAMGDFEVIVAEDDNAAETVSFLATMQQQVSYTIQHVSQEDKGFRKCRILNQALLASSTGFLIFLDGDCIPHRQLVYQYTRNKDNAGVLYGRRVMLSKKFSSRLLATKDLAMLNFFSMLAGGCKRIEEGLYLPFVNLLFKRKKSTGLLGCNMGIQKEALLAINGFDEDYTAPGAGEDSDIEWRLTGFLNVTYAPMKFKAIVYHVWHQERFTEEVGEKSLEALTAKMNQGIFICKNGINKLPSS